MGRRANNLRNPFAAGFELMTDITATATGARSPAVKEGAKVLRREIKRTLSHPGGGEPSAPGQPPAKQEGDLQKSIGYGVVDGEMRVGSRSFVAPLLEYGTVTGTPGGTTVDKATRRRRRNKQGRQGKATKPRPFMRESLERALPDMGDAAVAGMRRFGQEITG